MTRSIKLPLTSSYKFSWKKAIDTKILLPENLSDRVAQLKAQDRTLVTCNGCFDLLHIGHLHLLFEARRQGDCLIVCLNSDHSIQQNKGEGRPRVSLEERLPILASLEVVDFVTWFEEPDPIRCLAQIQPHVHVNGAEYGPNCIEAETIREGGGRLHLVDRVGPYSTSRLVGDEVCG